MALKKNLTFEAALGRLDEIVALLDRGEAPLDDALKLFGEGAELIAFCGGKLDKARLTVETLLPGPKPEENTDTDDIAYEDGDNE
jgi:exodeoxyribonuclease VII small subunit